MIRLVRTLVAVPLILAMLLAGAGQRHCGGERTTG